MVEEHFAGCGPQESLQNLIEIVSKAGALASIPALVTAALDHRGIAVDARLPPFVELLLSALAPSEGSSSPPLSAQEVAEGSAAVARALHHQADDMPKAPELVGSQMFAPLIAQGVFKLDAILSLVLQVPPLEDGADAPLVEGDGGEGLVFGVMSR